MARATIELTDTDGLVDCRLVFEDGFQRDSAAHQHAQILIALMDREMQRQGQPEVQTMTIEQPPAAEPAPTIIIARG